MKCSAKLVAYTQPVIGIPASGPEALVAYCARVSNPSNQDNPDYEGLLKYCIRNKHWSVFEMANAVLEVNTTRDIGRQLLRHRSFSFQEFSQRYADVTALDVPFEFRDCRMQDHKNRQNSTQMDLTDADNRDLNNLWVAKQQSVLRTAREAYSWAIDNGVAKEQARALLPEGMTKSRLYVNGTLRSWIHFIQVRSDKSTQKEHREIAEQAKEVLSTVFPITIGALNDQ